MGSNRKLIFGVVLLVAGLVFWGLITALSGVNTPRVATTPTAIAGARGTPGAQTANAGGNRMVAYAAANIPEGTLVTKNMIEMRALQGNGPTSAFVTDPQVQALNFVTGTRIPKDGLIRPSDDFVGHISDVGVAGMLRVGTRAIVIPFANKPTLHDLVAIGNLVDINAAFDGQESRTIVPGVRVLAVDVFGSDFPQVNIARRGAFRAEARIAPTSDPGAAPPNGAPNGAPNGGPTPTPTPPPTAGRPDPAITLEVTPDQANRILLAQSSGGVLDFVVLPSRGDASIVPGGTLGTPGDPGALIGEGLGESVGLTTISAVTRPQLAPYAERRKAAGAAPGGGTRTASASAAGSGGSARSPRLSRNDNFGPPPAIPSGNGSSSDVSLPPAQPDSLPVAVPSGPEFPAPTPESPTYNIPIYADGRTVRVETVPRPQD